MKRIKKTILLVDDDRSVRESLRKILEESGYEVIQAADGEEGSHQIHNGTFDLVVLDLDLPKMCGFDLLDMMSDKCPGRRVVVLTGMLDHCEPGSLSGADLVLEKPPEVGILLNGITTLLASEKKPAVRTSNTRRRHAGGTSLVGSATLALTGKGTATSAPSADLRPC